MTMDPGLQVFAEESRELLQQMEDTLLKLENNSNDPELINELFRAVHTIKGSAGLFGFDHVVGFTHITETIMVKAREGELRLDEGLLNLLLECRDHVETLVEYALTERDIDEGTGAKGQALASRLNGLLIAAVGADQGAAPDGEDVNAEAAELTGDEAVVLSKYWHLSLRFGRDALRSGMDPLSFFRYLSTVGDIENLTAIYDELPGTADMDPESCYLGFEIDLNSEADKTTIEGVFEFAQDDCVVHILAPGSQVSEYLRLIEALPEENLRLGELLTMSGALTQRELDAALAEQAAQSAPAQPGAYPQPAPPIGEVIVKQGVVDQPVVAAALDKQDKVKEKRSLEQQLVRVDAGKLEILINLVGELVISGANTELMAQRVGDPALSEASERMSLLVEQIRDSAPGLRMVQIGETFNRYRRVVRELSREVGKNIELVISGAETELDKTVVEKISDPLMHLVRNAVDHGIESPELRAERGKPARGVLGLHAYHDSGSIVIEGTDDGGGLPLERILAKATERGLVKPNQTLSDNEVFRLIFEPGFSTAESVTNISGRGVGMDVVRRNIDALRGQVDVESTAGEGTKFIIRLPLTLAIIDGFQVRVGGSSYVLPLDLVEECIELDAEQHDLRKSGNYVNLRGEVLPFVRLGELFHEGNGDAEKTTKKHRDNIVVVQYAGHKTGLVVDELLGEYQTVIKPLGRVFENLKGISGATILGSGEVAMIVDVPGLIQRVVSRTGNPENGAVRDNVTPEH